jgi:hypothetical protein
VTQWKLPEGARLAVRDVATGEIRMVRVKDGVMVDDGPAPPLSPDNQALLAGLAALEDAVRAGVEVEVKTGPALWVSYTCKVTA